MPNLPPVTLNGYPVIEYDVHANCATIMVERCDNAIKYVVATWWPSLGTSWSWGHYCATIGEARAAFTDANKRNRNR